MKCIEDNVIPKHIKGDDREIILDKIIKSNKTQIQADGEGNTYVNLFSSRESLVEQVKNACDKLNIVYTQQVCSTHQRSHPRGAVTSGYATYINTYKTIYKMTDEEKIEVLTTAMQGWGGTPDGVLIFSPIRHVTGVPKEE